MVSTPTKSTIAHLVDPLFFIVGPPEAPLGFGGSWSKSEILPSVLSKIRHVESSQEHVSDNLELIGGIKL